MRGKTMKNAKGILELARMTESEARTMLEKIRWSDGVVCPWCGCVDNSTKLGGKAGELGQWKCKDCRKKFTVTAHTVMHRSHVPLTKWVLAIFLMCSSKKGISSLQLKRQLNLGSYQSAWHLTHRIRLAMTEGQFGQMGQDRGIIEADEAFFHVGKSREKGLHTTGSGTKKVAILTLVDRKTGRAVSRPVAKVSKDTISPFMKDKIDKSASIMSDQERSYLWTNRHFAEHLTTNHSRDEYARWDLDKDGRPINVHSNTAESFFNLLRRGFIGSFHKWSAQHIHRYCSEFDFRWTHRKITDFERTVIAIKGVEGRRLTYKALPSPSLVQ
jgi:transposase-like protein